MNRPYQIEKQSRRSLSGDARTGLSAGTPVTESNGGALASTSPRTIVGFQAAILVIAPAVMLTGLYFHPYLPGTLPNSEAVAAAVASDPVRWGIVHFVTAVGSGLLVLAFLAIRSYLREAGEEQWSLLGFPLIVIGSMLYALLPAMEFAPMAAAEAGADIQAIHAALGPWFRFILLTGGIIFALGVLAFVMGLIRSRVLGRLLTGFVVGGLVVMAAARFVPLSAVQFYVQGAAGLLALWPLAYQMWKHA